MGQSDLGDAARRVREYDRDRFATVLFAPADRREALFALYAVNLEIAGIRERVREPMMGLMRLQWWRDALEGVWAGDPPAHPLLGPLAAAVRRHDLARAEVEALLTAREGDMDDAPPPDLATLEDYAEATAGSLAVLATQILGVHGDAALGAARAAGTAWGLTGLLRAVPFHAALGRVTLPESLLREAGVPPRDITPTRVPEGVARVAVAVAARAEAHLAAARLRRREIDRAALPALLPATAAEVYLRRLRRHRHDLTDARWSQPRPPVALMAWRVLRGRY